MKQGYIKSLDGVRAIAIILVMAFHAGLVEFGWMGVQLFFVLSGFLITRILWSEKKKDTPLHYKFKKFWVRRSLRIFPLYFGFLIFLGITYLVADFPYYYSRFIPYLSTYTFNYTRTFEDWIITPLFTHLWSLSIEEQFYFFFPLVIFFTPPRFIKIFMIAVVLLSPLIRLLLGNYFTSQGHSEFVVADAVYWHTLSHLDAFFAGGLISILSLDSKITKPGRWLLFSVILVISAGFLNYLLVGEEGSYLLSFGYGHGRSANYEHVWYYTVLNFMFAALVLNLVSDRTNSLIKKVLENPWMVRIGRVSYGMYIFHWAILTYVFFHFFNMENAGTRWLLFIPYLATVYLFSELSFRLFEVKFINMKDRFFPDRHKAKDNIPSAETGK